MFCCYHAATFKNCLFCRRPRALFVPTVYEATDPQDLDTCFSIRIVVFCHEQQVSREIEFDGLDDQCRHYLAILDKQGIGTARVRPLDDSEVKLERVAVRSEHRHLGIGRRLMELALADAQQAGYKGAMLNSQVQACPFYEKLGFRAEGAGFYEAGIPHRRMRRVF